MTVAHGGLYKVVWDTGLGSNGAWSAAGTKNRIYAGFKFIPGNLMNNGRVRSENAAAGVQRRGKLTIEGRALALPNQRRSESQERGEQKW